MKPRIEILSQKKLVGKSLDMSLTKNKVTELWKSFMPKIKHIKQLVDNNLYSMQVHDANMAFEKFTPQMVFTQWAAVETASFNDQPDGLETYLLKGGLYAVFLHKGAPDSFSKTMEYIHQQWLPNSKYELDNREHFELLGDRYINNHPDSEEEVWVPIKAKIEK